MLCVCGSVPSGLVACCFALLLAFILCVYTYKKKMKKYFCTYRAAYGVNISSEYLKPLIEPASILLIPRYRTDSGMLLDVYDFRRDRHTCFFRVCVHHARMPLSPIQQHNNKNTQMPITLYNLSFRTHSNVQKKYQWKSLQNLPKFYAQSPD